MRATDALCFVVAGLLVACGDDRRSNADTGAAASMAPSETPAGPVAVDILRACDVATPCGYSSAQLAEQSPHVGRENFKCLMLALGSRTPGRYEHLTDDTNGFSSSGIDHVLVVSGDGSVRFATSSSRSTATAPQVVTTYQPAMRCSLREASYFEACAAAVDGFTGLPDSPVWPCAFDDLQRKWLERCDEAPLLSCE